MTERSRLTPDFLAIDSDQVEVLGTSLRRLIEIAEENGSADGRVLGGAQDIGENATFRPLYKVTVERLGTIG